MNFGRSLGLQFEQKTTICKIVCNGMYIVRYSVRSCLFVFITFNRRPQSMVHNIFDFLEHTEIHIYIQGGRKQLNGLSIAKS